MSAQTTTRPARSLPESGTRAKRPARRAEALRSKENSHTGGPIAAAYAKAQFSELLSRVERDGKEIAITRRGRVVAHLVPAPEQTGLSNFDRVFGSMKGTGVVVGDIVSPDWEAWGPEWK